MCKVMKAKETMTHRARCWRFGILGAQMGLRREHEMMLVWWQSQITMVLLCYGRGLNFILKMTCSTYIIEHFCYDSYYSNGDNNGN